ncbi:hypothetical protein HBN50_11165 [Halobacteriovorax sp. GB3]|uniref:hypothetical protein n=1 Tax=Halobacteriovorax sp. GB3 TaxID=2719615 RepID=UPI00235FB26F|nr:hypothetical protein [Halobacteriovorax sp. GB3]MDD0853659.1 hypothetical protein [Halobacteriovorax sp. GB3]
MKINHIILLATLSISGVAHADLLSTLVQRYMTKVFSNGHAKGLPADIEQRPEAIAYREAFIKEMGIQEVVDELGLTQFEGSNIGLALVKKGNENEGAFRTILAKKNYALKKSWKNGKYFIKALEEYTSAKGCIPKITSVSHGWRSGGRKGEGHGLSGQKGFNGIYVNQSVAPEKIAKIGTRTLEKDMKEAMRKGTIRFCDLCIAQFYACNVSTFFAKSFAKITGCQTVVATGQNSPYFQSSQTQEEIDLIDKGAHYWKSESGAWEERQTDVMKEKGQLKGTWYRATPLEDSMVEENLGKTYLSI